MTEGHTDDPTAIESSQEKRSVAQGRIIGGAVSRNEFPATILKIGHRVYNPSSYCTMYIYGIKL